MRGESDKYLRTYEKDRQEIEVNLGDKNFIKCALPCKLWAS